jgi:hypothetical protein
MAIWQELVDGHGFGEKYSNVKASFELFASRGKANVPGMA